MTKKRSIYESNPQIVQDKLIYYEKLTVAFINPIVDILAEATFADWKSVCPSSYPILRPHLLVEDFEHLSDVIYSTQISKILILLFFPIANPAI